MPTASELVILGLVACLAVQGGHLTCQHDVVVLKLRLTVQRLVTVIAGDVGLAMLTPLELVDHGRGFFPVTLRAPTRGLCELRNRRPCVTQRPRAVHHHRRDDEAAPDEERDED